jgi:hypothetical protein
VALGTTAGRRSWVVGTGRPYASDGRCESSNAVIPSDRSESPRHPRASGASPPSSRASAASRGICTPSRRARRIVAPRGLTRGTRRRWRARSTPLGTGMHPCRSQEHWEVWIQRTPAPAGSSRPGKHFSAPPRLRVTPRGATGRPDQGPWRTGLGPPDGSRGAAESRRTTTAAHKRLATRRPRSRGARSPRCRSQGALGTVDGEGRCAGSEISTSQAVTAPARILRVCALESRCARSRIAHGPGKQRSTHERCRSLDSLRSLGMTRRERAARSDRDDRRTGYPYRLPLPTTGTDYPYRLPGVSQA